MTIWDLLLRASLAVVLGLAIGWDREKKEKAAGLRTMALVSLGSAGMMLAAYEIMGQVGGEDVRLDPLRVAAGVIGGIGFLGAGAILHSRHHVHGLTTAASIWAAAVIGIACGAGLYRLALVLAGLVLVVLVVITALKGTVLPDHSPGHHPNHDHAEAGDPGESDR